LTGQIVKSLGDHWAAGAKSFIAGSTYENKDQVLNASGAVEYNFFSYSESSRRQLTLQYVVGVTAYDYIEETVYGTLSETAPNHVFRSSFDTRQTWGSISADVGVDQRRRGGRSAPTWSSPSSSTRPPSAAAPCKSRATCACSGGSP
jgi:hypothetical protein